MQCFGEVVCADVTRDALVKTYHAHFFRAVHIRERHKANVGVAGGDIFHFIERDTASLYVRTEALRYLHIFEPRHGVKNRIADRICHARRRDREAVG